MKRSKTILLALALSVGAALYAAESGQVDIDAQIEKIKNAPPSQRRELMNRFKMELANMNRQQRMEAIEQLRASMQTQMHHGGERGYGMMPPPMQKVVNGDQMWQTQHLGHMEMMGQHQGEKQFMHEHPQFRPHDLGAGADSSFTPGTSAPSAGGTPGAGSAPSAGGGSTAPGHSAGGGSPHRPSTPLPFSVRK